VSKEALKLFEAFDVDADNAMSYSEFCLMLVLVSVPLKDIQAIFSIIDGNDDGTIDRHEFWDLVTRLRSFGTRSGTPNSSLVPKPGFITECELQQG